MDFIEALNIIVYYLACIDSSSVSDMVEIAIIDVLHVPFIVASYIGIIIFCFGGMVPHIEWDDQSPAPQK